MKWKNQLAKLLNGIKNIFRNKMIFITGKTGLIAGRLAKKLSNQNLDVKLLSHNEMNLLSPKEFDYSNIQKNDFVINLAAVSSPDLCETDYQNAKKINFDGTKIFIENCLGQGAKVLFFSSDAVYGESAGDEVFNENSSPHPRGKYGEMKLAIEKEFENNENFRVFRLSYVFSKDDKVTSYYQKCSEENRIAEIYEPYSRNMIYIEDVVAASENLMENFERFNFKIINLGGPKNLSRSDLGDLYRLYVNKNFQYNVIYPGDKFYAYRAKNIYLKSLYLKDLLGREPIDIEKAMQIEFNCT